MSVKDILNKV